MGIGFCIVISEEDADEALKIISAQGKKAYKIGFVVQDNAKTVEIRPANLIGENKSNKFRKKKVVAI